MLLLPGAVDLNTLVGQRRARDVAAQLLECLAVITSAAHGVQAESLLVGAQRLRARSVSRHSSLHREHLLPGARAKGNAVGTRQALGCRVFAGLAKKLTAFSRNPYFYETKPDFCDISTSDVNTMWAPQGRLFNKKLKSRSTAKTASRTCCSHSPEPPRSSQTAHLRATRRH